MADTYSCFVKLNYVNMCHETWHDGEACSETLALVNSTVNGVPDAVVCKKHAHCHHCGTSSNLNIITVYDTRYNKKMIGIKCNFCLRLKRFLIFSFILADVALSAGVISQVANAANMSMILPAGPNYGEMAMHSHHIGHTLMELGHW